MTNRERGSDQAGDRGREHRQRLYDLARRIEQRAATVDDPRERERLLRDAESYRAAAQEEAP
ncbi:MAG: hypothetical protein PSV22_14640 [Pseudolabrys sp.]|nr:hypothetical protein [Pseudolabrys sp.]